MSLVYYDVTKGTLINHYNNNICKERENKDRKERKKGERELKVVPTEWMKEI